MISTITEEMLACLRTDVSGRMSEKRFRHTAEVEKMVARLASLYVPEKESMLRAAALLHDVTKECTREEQIRLCAVYGLEVTEQDLASPKTFHARTAAALIPDRYPDFADEELLRCVRYHTTGRAGMTLEESLLYLADYIDMSRTFEDCVRLRNVFFDACPERMGHEERLCHLRDVMILSYDMTISALLEDGAPISGDTVYARNELICQKRREEQNA